MWKVDGNKFSNSWNVAECIEENGCMEDVYAELLDEQYGRINVAGFEYNASYILKELGDFKFAMDGWADATKKEMCLQLEKMYDGDVDTFYGVEVEYVED